MLLACFGPVYSSNELNDTLQKCDCGLLIPDSITIKTFILTRDILLFATNIVQNYFKQNETRNGDAVHCFCKQHVKWREINLEMREPEIPQSDSIEFLYTELDAVQIANPIPNRGCSGIYDDQMGPSPSSSIE